MARAAIAVFNILILYLGCNEIAASGLEAGSLSDLPAIRSGEAPVHRRGRKLDGNMTLEHDRFGRMLMQRSDSEDMTAWRGRIDPKYGRTYMAPAIAQNKCDGDQECYTTVGSYPYEKYIIDPTGSSNEPVMKIGYPKVSLLLPPSAPPLLLPLLSSFLLSALS